MRWPPAKATPVDLSLSPTAQTQPLRITLVWTDPPGNPVASVKLVNDLDLVVTNLDTREVFYRQRHPAGQRFQPAVGHQCHSERGHGEQRGERLSVARLTVNARLSTNYSDHRRGPPGQRERGDGEPQQRGPGLCAGHLQRRRRAGQRADADRLADRLSDAAAGDRRHQYVCQSSPALRAASCSTSASAPTRRCWAPTASCCRPRRTGCSPWA